MTTLKNVVFPAPFGPIRPTIERAGMTRSTWLTATRPPKALVTPRASSRGRPPASRGAAADRSQAGMLSARGIDGAAARRPASSVSSTSTAAGRTRRPTSPSGLKSMTSASPSPKKNQRHSVRSTVVRMAMPVWAPTHRTRCVICASRRRSNSVISIPPTMTPLRLPMPPSTTMHSSMMDTLNSKAPGVMAWSFAA